MDRANIDNDSWDESGSVPNQRGVNSYAKQNKAKLVRANQQLVLYLSQNKAFNEGEATRVLCQTPEGIMMQFDRDFGDRLKAALSIAKTLVFQESTKQRFERVKLFEVQQDPTANEPKTVAEGIHNLEVMLDQNDINRYTFARVTQMHFYRETKKRNLFFHGPPGTGKTMIMESLMKMHFNYCRLTGLTPNSPYNFASLLHTNACFMDECKLTDDQFEQWKLLAGGQAMSIDVKYKNRHDISNCVLYTASKYPINAYLTVQGAKDAVETRTIHFSFCAPVKHFNINAFMWEMFWEKYADDSVDTLDFEDR